MTCKDSWKETGLFSLEDAEDRQEEQLDAPQRAVSVGFQLCSSRNHMAGSWSDTGVQEEGCGKGLPTERDLCSCWGPSNLVLSTVKNLFPRSHS